MRPFDPPESVSDTSAGKVRWTWAVDGSGFASVTATVIVVGWPTLVLLLDITTADAWMVAGVVIV